MRTPSAAEHAGYASPKPGPSRARSVALGVLALLAATGKRLHVVASERGGISQRIRNPQSTRIGDPVLDKDSSGRPSL